MGHNQLLKFGTKKMSERSIAILKNFLTTLFFTIVMMAGGCVFQQENLLEKKQQSVLASYKQHIRETVDDHARTDELIAIGEKLHRQLRADARLLNEMFLELEKLNNSYDTSRSELEMAFHVINLHRKQMQNTIMVARSKIPTLTTPEEWQRLINRRTTLIELIKSTPGFL